MKVFAVSDLHLPGNQNKPMDIFGGNWNGHLEKIKSDWQEKVKADDIVLISGDTSWAMQMDDAIPDISQLKGLAGKKVFIRGNHDYWWSGITTLRRRAPDSSFYFLQNDCVRFENLIICGSRGWSCPGSADFTEADKKIYQREGERFRLALQCADRERKVGDTVYCMVHFPPFNNNKEDSVFTELFENHGVSKVIFGHLHANAGGYPMRCERKGIEYILTSCDLLDFKLTEIAEF